jgi:hypothetical protein
LSCVAGVNDDFEGVNEFYANLKRKYFGYVQHLHSVELFSEGCKYIDKARAQLFRIKKYRKKYIEELCYFLDTVPFTFNTVIVDKKKLLSNLTPSKIDHPWATTIGRAKEIFRESGYEGDEFRTSNIVEILSIVSNYEIIPVDYFRPLEMALKKILETHFDYYYSNIFHKESKLQMCFETSPNQVRILKLIEKFLLESRNDNSGVSSFLADQLKNNLYAVSFANKKAKYLGLEIADIISYGYYLSSHRRRKENTLYSDIWKVIQRRKRDIERNTGINCVSRK